MAGVKLACIAKNEAKSLRALAEATLPLIDSWCIVLDPRTDDDTEKLAYELFGHLPGAVHTSQVDIDTEGFAAARNELLSIAREPDTYLLLLDPDSPTVGNVPENLTHDLYICDEREPSTGNEWMKPLLLSSDVECEYRCPAHEYLDVDHVTDVEYLPDIYVLRSGEGATIARQEWAASVLQRVLDEGGRDAPRACLYLANTLHTLGRNEEAVAAYERRAAMESDHVGDDVDRWFAQYRFGVLVQTTDPMRAVSAFLVAHGMRPGRVEPLYRLAAISNSLGEHRMGLALATQAASIPPTADPAFVERWIEMWGIHYQWAIAMRALGDINAALDIARQLSRRKDVPAEVKADVRTWLLAA